ncbi:MAG TPA: insulinase family protein, partial [Candidatus Polarisedimenticolia bacterium]|nr:insulinase family protein [Candidatus Polarisedimenticolia bacterium]
TATAARAAADLDAARRFSLDNGLTVLTLRDASQPVVAVQMLYRVGARNETTGVTGISHFIEHMLFRGTVSFGLADVTGVIERAGGEWHGYTYLDCTTFFQAAPRDLLPTLLRLEAERMTEARMAPAEVEPERGAVFQEYRGYQNDARSDLFDLTIATLFLEHPYRNNTMGWESDLAGITHGDLVAFYRRYYGPRNAVLSIVGDFDASRIEEQVRRVFASIPASGESTAIRTVEPEPTGERRITIRRPGAAPAVMVAFPAPPPARPREYAALLVLDALLGHARGLSFRSAENDQTAGADAEPGSRLGRALAGSPADRFGTAFVPTLYPYHYSIYATPATGRSPEEIPPVIDAVLAGVARSLTRPEVDTARRRIEAALLLETDSPVELAHELAFWTGLGGMEIRAAVVRELKAIGPDEVRALARSFVPKRSVVGILLPEGAPDGADQAGAARPAVPGTVPPAPTSAAGTASGAPGPAVRLRRADQARVETLRLAPGGRAIVDARPDQKTFVLRVAATCGGSGMAALARLRDATRRLEEDGGTRAALADLGVRLTLLAPGEGTFSDRDTAQAELQGPADAFAETAQIFAPALKRALGDASSTPTPRATGPPERALQILAEAISPAETPAGPPPSAPPAISIALVSPYGAPATRSLLASLVPAGAAPVATAGKGEAWRSALPAGRREETIPGIAQGRLLIALPGNAEDKEALAALTYILHHAYSGRLGVKAIAEMGLVYEMESEAVTRGEPLLYVTMGAEPQSLPRLEAALTEVLDRTATTLTEREVAEYRSFAAGDLVVRLADPEKAARLYGAALLRGEDHTGPRAGVERARALTTGRVAALARAALDPARRLTVVVTRPATGSP